MLRLLRPSDSFGHLWVKSADVVSPRLTVGLESLRAGSNAAWFAWHHAGSVRTQYLLGHQINLNITLVTSSVE